MPVQPRDYLTASANMEEARQLASSAVAKVDRALEFLASAASDFQSIGSVYGPTVTFIQSQSNTAPWGDLKAMVSQLQADFAANRTRTEAIRNVAQTENAKA